MKNINKHTFYCYRFKCRQCGTIIDLCGLDKNRHTFQEWNKLVYNKFIEDGIYAEFNYCENCNMTTVHDLLAISSKAKKE